MDCVRCDQRDRVAVRRVRTVERDGKVAVILQVPMEECRSCGERWLGWDVAIRVETLVSEMLASDAEVTTRHFHEQPAP